jgi:ACS family tartrate transporter-like MFS transporter
MIGMVGGFVGPYWMGAARQLTGDYQRGLLTLAIPSVVAALLIVVLARTGAQRQSAEAAVPDAVDAATL